MRTNRKKPKPKTPEAVPNTDLLFAWVHGREVALIEKLSEYFLVSGAEELQERHGFTQEQVQEWASGTIARVRVLPPIVPQFTAPKDKQ